MSARIEVVEDPERACAEAMAAVAARGGHIVLTGGSTPEQAYEQFADSVRSGAATLHEVTFWFGDERCVGPDDELSNYRLARTSLFDRLETSGYSARRMQGELGPEAGAADYELQLREEGPPQFDLLLLGLGPDGHVASLFPDQATLSERERLVVGVPEAGFEPYVPRISLTFPALGLAREILFLVSGSKKADAVAAAFGPDAKSDPHVPASLVGEWARGVRVILDAEAAARL